MGDPLARISVNFMTAAYLDYQATTPIDPRVLERMQALEETRKGFGNPHSASHEAGRKALSEVSAARREIADLIGADEGEIVFTSGATEANNLAILGAFEVADSDRQEIVVSSVEHKSVLAAARHLETKGFTLRVAPVDVRGRIDLDALCSLVGQSTRLVSIMATNNEIGVEQDIPSIASIVRAKGSLFHVDAAQALATRQVDVAAWGADFMSLSCHKAYGPKGIGALFVTHEARHRIRPILFGGEQEGGLRPGTLPTPLCVGFGEACRVLYDERQADIGKIRRLRDLLLARLREKLPSIEVNGAMEGRHPGNLNIRIPGVEADQLLAMCEGKIAGATGSACTSGTPEPSHVLMALGRSRHEAEESIRLSLGRFSTDTDVDRAVEALSGASALLQRLGSGRCAPAR